MITFVPRIIFERIWYSEFILVGTSNKWILKHAEKWTLKNQIFDNFDKAKSISWMANCKRSVEWKGSRSWRFRPSWLNSGWNKMKKRNTLFMPRSTHFEIYVSFPWQMLLTEKEHPEINLVGKIKYILTRDSHMRRLCHALQYTH